jgi:hypothetical protein
LNNPEKNYCQPPQVATAKPGLTTLHPAAQLFTLRPRVRAAVQINEKINEKIL